jgi:hypothetical protein
MHSGLDGFGVVVVAAAGRGGLDREMSDLDAVVKAAIARSASKAPDPSGPAASVYWCHRRLPVQRPRRGGHPRGEARRGGFQHPQERRQLAAALRRRRTTPTSPHIDRQV